MLRCIILVSLGVVHGSSSCAATAYQGPAVQIIEAPDNNAATWFLVKEISN